MRSIFQQRCRRIAHLLHLTIIGLMFAQPCEAQDGVSFARDAQAILTSLESHGDWVRARSESEALFDRAVLHLPESKKNEWTAVASMRRLVVLLQPAEEHRNVLLPWLLQHDDVRHAVAFAYDMNQDIPVHMCAILHELISKRGDKVVEYPELTAALCIVHDRPMVQNVNENVARSAPPIDLFDYYTRFESRTWFGMRTMPARLLAYVVDTTASLDDMVWATEQYARCNDIGALFFEIEYDVEHYRDGSQKQVTANSWNLPNIKKYGGVCADQAYFATTVGKSLGVPTTYTWGHSASVGHAWVGVLRANRTQAAWDFNSGRYAAYQGVRGTVIDPQTRKRIPDSYVSLLAGYGLTRPSDRWFVGAMSDAADRIRESLSPTGLPFADSDATARTLDVAGALELLEAGLRGCPAYADAWLTVADFSERGQLDRAQKESWARVLDRMCGQRYPYFYFDILAPMIASVEDPDQQLKLWERSLSTFRNQKDLLAAVRMKEAELFLRNDEPAKAGRCYEMVMSEFANDGPFVLEAIAKAEGLLRAMNSPDRVLALYERAWSNLKRPPHMAAEFAQQSNWFRIGTRYANLLEAAGLTNDARKIRSRIGM